MEHPDAKPYSLQWFMQELVKAVFIAIAMLVLSIAGVGMLQAYLLPDRMDKESAKIQDKFDKQIKQIHDESVKRESELLEKLELLQQQYSEAISKLKQAHPTEAWLDPAKEKSKEEYWRKFEERYKNLDPEKARLKWIQEHSKD